MIALLTTITVDTSILIGASGIVTAIGVIIGAFVKAHNQVLKWDSYDKKIADVNKRIDDVDKKLSKFQSEQCMQTYVLEAVLDGLHQLGCNGKTTEASEKLAKFINKQAHDQ